MSDLMVIIRKAMLKCAKSKRPRCNDCPLEMYCPRLEW